ncbi:hypothetical protein HF325_000014 [Metschnikowia pulcherrima]|uniref:DUF833-domain-containing protein n=1 Tax=Metschnikowia pulcherrima TaxID=27326 RepID=A0A8H7LGZ7_9ASCO|nr:hypothetical protein HF325_000014 [Metschnikowia pulcherrima]
MCILISTTSHPDYPIIVLSNRDEFFARPTQLASARNLENGVKIISPLDLGRSEHGTWIGVTSEGKIAMLLNYREKKFSVSKVSRGILPIDYLTSSLDEEEWYRTLEVNLTKSIGDGEPVTLGDIGGFTLIYGKLQKDPLSGKLAPLNIMSNRGDRGKIHASVSDDTDQHSDIAKQEHFSVSNSLYYEPWAKANLGTELLAQVVSDAVNKDYTQEELTEACFQILSTNTYDPSIQHNKDEFSEAKLVELRNSIFIPPLDTAKASATPFDGASENRFYGTRTQTVIMYHKSGDIHYYERDLYDGDTNIQKVRYQHFVMHIDTA